MTEQVVETEESLLTSDYIHTQLREAPLSALDRCDRCGAQAYIRMAVNNTALDLLFCGHHYVTVKDSVNMTLLRDEREKLTAKPVITNDDDF